MRQITVGGSPDDGVYFGKLVAVEEGKWTGPYAGRDAIVWTFEIKTPDGLERHVERSGVTVKMGPHKSHLRTILEGLLCREVERSEQLDPETFIGSSVTLTLKNGRIETLTRLGD